MRKALIGCTSFEAAHEVDDYPYGQLRTKIRYWIEEKARHGQRFVSCTLNPKTGRWNKPHAGTYSEVLVMFLEPQPDGREFVRCGGLHFHSCDAEINALRLLVGDGALPMARIEVMRRARDAMNNAYRALEARIKTAPLLPFGELAQTEEVLL